MLLIFIPSLGSDPADAFGTVRILFENIGKVMEGVGKDVTLRHIGHCLKADLAYGRGVAKALVVESKT